MRRVLLSVLVVFGLCWGIKAQEKPNFAGSWKLVKDEPAGFKGGRAEGSGSPKIGAGWGAHSSTLAIAQTATEITIESTQFVEGEQRKMVYKLDGSEVVTDDPMHPGDRRFRWKTKARWNGAELILYTHQNWNDMRDKLSLAGGQLTIGQDTDGQSGGTTAVSGTHKLTYSK